MLTSSSLYNVSNAGYYERLIHFTMLVIHADVNI